MKHGAGATRKPNDGFVRKFGTPIAVYSGSRGGESTKSEGKEVALTKLNVGVLAGRRAASVGDIGTRRSRKQDHVRACCRDTHFPAFAQERRSLINDHE